MIICEKIACESIHKCWDSYECNSTALSDNSTSDSNIECFAYHSCNNAIKIESTSNADILCYGSFSCYKANLIQHIGFTNKADICCNGLYSCAFAEYIYNENGNIYC